MLFERIWDTLPSRCQQIILCLGRTGRRRSEADPRVSCVWRLCSQTPHSRGGRKEGDFLSCYQKPAPYVRWEMEINNFSYYYCYCKYSQHLPGHFYSWTIMFIRFEFNHVANHKQQYLITCFLPSGISRVPCGVCSIISQCISGGLVSPQTCQYMKEWLEFWCDHVTMWPRHNMSVSDIYLLSDHGIRM